MPSTVGVMQPQLISLQAYLRILLSVEEGLVIIAIRRLATHLVELLLK